MSDDGAIRFAFESDANDGLRFRRFSHNAMAATFEIFISGEDEGYARQAAAAAFEELDWIEKELSRFIETSDISQVNRLAPGIRMRCGLAAFECLVLSREMWKKTRGAFDIAHGSDRELSPAMRHLILHPDTVEVEVAAQGVRLDLGGIGKGYALDKMAESLREWSIESALIHGGQSTVSAFGAPPGSDRWTIELRSPAGRSERLGEVSLDGRAMSGSGIDPKAPHVVDARKESQETRTIAAWSVAPGAAVADALSTAFMLMPPGEIDRLCQENPDYAGAILTSGGESHALREFGKW